MPANKKVIVHSDFKKRLYFFTLKLIEFIDQLPKDNVSQKMGDELFNCGTKVISNYIEGKAIQSKKDLTASINISLKSISESKLWLALLRDSSRAKPAKVKWFIDELDEISKIITSE